MTLLPTRARDWQSLGYLIFPCATLAKVPAISNGVDGARNDWTRREWPRWANIGIACGPDSGPRGLWVLDVEEEARMDLGELPPLPVTLEIATPRGGRHYWFSWPESGLVANAQRIRVGDRRRAIDVRGDRLEGGAHHRGYILASPSVVEYPPEKWPPDGGRGRYEIVTWMDPAPAPDWLLSLVQRQPDPIRASPPRRIDYSGQDHPWAVAALARSCESIRARATSTNPEPLLVAATVSGHHVGAGIISEARVRAELDAAATDCGIRSGPRRRALDTGIAAGIREPHYPPERP